MAGDVTLVPSLGFRDYLRIISDPSLKDLESYMLRGQRATWPALARIKNHLLLEQTLDACARSLANEAAEQALADAGAEPSE